MILNQNTQNNAFTNLYTIGRSTNYQNQNPAPPAVTPATVATHIFDLIQNLNKGMYILKGAELTRSTSAYALPLFQPRPELSGPELVS